MKRPETKERVNLLPPTPSIVSNIRSRDSGGDACRHLSLASPDPRLLNPRPSLAPVTTATPVRSTPTATLFRRFTVPQVVTHLWECEPSKGSPCTSPSLKLKSPNLTTQSQDLNLSSRTTKGSLSDFNPMLSSTAAVSEERPVTPVTLTFSELGDLTSRGNTPTFSELAETSSQMATHETNQSKIDKYRKVLDGLKAKSLTQDKSKLMSAWTAHRESLSPSVKARRSRSPVGRVLQEPATPTPVTPVTVRKEDPLEPPPPHTICTTLTSPKLDLVISRLDQLMTSLTLNEDPNELDEMALMSPNM